MYLKAIHLIYFMLLALVFGCKQTVESLPAESGSQEENRQTILALEEIISKTFEGLNSMNIDTVFLNMSMEQFEGFAGNGVALRSYEETYTVLKYMYSEIEQYKITLSDEKYTLLSEFSAMYTANYKEVLKPKHGDTNYSNGVYTFILKKFDQDWKIIYMHTSSYPYQIVK